MGVRKAFAATAAAMAIAAGSDSELGAARSFTIPTECVDAVVCASLCRSAAEQGPTESDFIALASWPAPRRFRLFAARRPNSERRVLSGYELGPDRPIALPPANMSMPAPVDPHNVYAGTGAGMFSPAVAGQLTRVYSPNLTTGKVDVIDPETFKVIESLNAIPSPEHIVPSWDLQTLWVSGDVSYRGGPAHVMPIDPRTGKLGKAIDVPDSYNMYFTPDGKSAIIVAEAMRRLEFRDPYSMQLQGAISTPRCPGLNHADFSADGSYAIFTCEFGNALAKIDLVHHALAGILPLSPGRMPQDIRIAPDGSAFFVADMMKDGLVVIDGDAFKETGFIPTGVGAHGLYPSRDGTKLYVANRGTHNLAGQRNGQGSVSVLDFATRKVVANWTIPGGGSPDMGNLSADGKWLWLSGRYDGVIYAFNTDDGSVKSIPVGGMPHGLTVWPQPGRYSLGHTGNMR